MDRAHPRLRIGPAALVALGLMVAPALWSGGGAAGAAPATTGTLGVSTTQVTVALTTAVPLVPTVTIPPTSASTAPPVATTRRAAATLAPGKSTSTTASTSTTTTIAPIPTASPAPVTLPLATEPQSATISPVFSVLSLVGFAALIVLLIAQWYLTGPGRRGPTL